jgi:hypothetical protein
VGLRIQTEDRVDTNTISPGRGLCQICWVFPAFIGALVAALPVSERATCRRLRFAKAAPSG